MTNQDKARELVNKIKSEIKQEEESKVVKTGKEEMERSLSILQQNAELMDLYKESASLGADNLGGESPILRVHTTGKSSNLLSNGSEPNNGWFFYKPTGEQFEYIECHILYISKGFRANGINRSDVYNQIMAGIITNDGSTKTFVMYLNGKKLSKMWEFSKEASKYTKSKPIPIPMFALKVKLTTERIKTDYGFSFIINFEIMKNEDGTPIVVTDPGEFIFLRDCVESAQDNIRNIIDNSDKNNSELAGDNPNGEPKDLIFDSDGIPLDYEG